MATWLEWFYVFGSQGVVLTVNVVLVRRRSLKRFLRENPRFEGTSPIWMPSPWNAWAFHSSPSGDGLAPREDFARKAVADHEEWAALLDAPVEVTSPAGRG